jgi:hypothetical protein
MGRDTAFRAGSNKRCSAKAKLLKERAFFRPEAKRQEAKQMRRVLAAAARLKAPVAPNERTKLALLVGADVLADAERTLLEAHPHLDAVRDAPILLSLAYLNVKLAKAWTFFSDKARIAWASRSGKISWNAGLRMLITVEELHRRLAAELAVTRASRNSVGLKAHLEANAGATIVISGTTQEYIRGLKALAASNADLTDYNAQLQRVEQEDAVPNALAPGTSFRSPKESGEA